MTAWRFDSRILCSDVWSTSYWRYVKAPLTGAHAGHLAYPPQWRLFGCIWKWDCHLVPWWHWMAPFPPVFYLLSRLSQKVDNFCLHTYLFLLTSSTRVLLCCIRFLGNWPCPCCLVHKSEIQELGTKHDMNRQEVKKRVDDDRRHMLVDTAWEMIYENGVRPGHKVVSRLLDSRALNPMRMSNILCYFMKITCDYPS